MDPSLASFPGFGAFRSVISPHVQLDRKSLQQRCTDFAPVATSFRGVASAPFGMVSTRAQIHGSHNPGIGSPMGGAFSPVQVKCPRVHDVSQRLSRRPRPLRELIQKKQALVCQGPRTRQGLPPSPRSQQSPYASCGMWREKRCGHTFARWKQCVCGTGKCRFSHARGTHEHGVQFEFGPDAEPSFGLSFSLDVGPAVIFCVGGQILGGDRLWWRTFQQAEYL